MGAVGIGALAGAGLGAIRQEEQRKFNNQRIKMQALKTELSPFSSSFGPGDVSKIQTPSQFETMFGDGVRGAVIGSMFAGQTPEDANVAAADTGSMYGPLAGGYNDPTQPQIGAGSIGNDLMFGGGSMYNGPLAP